MGATVNGIYDNARRKDYILFLARADVTWPALYYPRDLSALKKTNYDAVVVATPYAQTSRYATVILSSREDLRDTQGTELPAWKIRCARDCPITIGLVLLPYQAEPKSRLSQVASTRRYHSSGQDGAW
jgi:hypothetical protein